MRKELGKGVFLCAEFSTNSMEVGTELYVWLEKDGVIIQDIATFRNSDIKGKREYPREHEGYVETLLWEDENNEDYTKKIVIPVREDEV